MEKRPPRPMPPFDELTIPSELQTLKLLLPYTPVSEQQSIWILIRFLELQHTIQFFRQQQNRLHSQTFRHFPASTEDMLKEIGPYLPPETAAMLDTFRNAMNIMEMMQMFQENTDASGNHSADTDASGNSPGNHSADTDSPEQQSPFNFSGINPMDLMMGMLSPEQQEMFQMYQSMFSDMDDHDNTLSDTDSSETSSAYDRSSDSETSDTEHLNPTVPDAGNPNPDNTDFS